MKAVSSASTRSAGGWHHYVDVTAYQDAHRVGESTDLIAPLLETQTVCKLSPKFPPYPTLAELLRYVTEPRGNWDDWNEWHRWRERVFA